MEPESAERNRPNIQYVNMLIINGAYKCPSKEQIVPTLQNSKVDIFSWADEKASEVQVQSGQGSNWDTVFCGAFNQA